MTPGARPLARRGFLAFLTAPALPALLALLALVALGGASPPADVPSRSAPAVELERTRWLMGSPLRIHVAAAERATALAATEAAFAEVARLEELLSTWIPTSALSRVNDAPVGEAVALPPEVSAILAEAAALSRSTGGAFDPAVGPLLEAWNVRGEGGRPDRRRIEEALAAVRAGVAVDAAAGTATRRHPGAGLDAGGFGKGAALRSAGRILLERGVSRALLDFAGQLLVVGEPGDEGWTTGVAHPRRRGESVAALRLDGGSVATSGTSERGRHILDPRTGVPSATRVSVTVLAADALVADALATALHVMGPEEGLAWIEGRARDRDDVGVLYLEDGPAGVRIRANERMKRRIQFPIEHP